MLVQRGYLFVTHLSMSNLMGFQVCWDSQNWRVWHFCRDADQERVDTVLVTLPHYKLPGRRHSYGSLLEANKTTCFGLLRGHHQVYSPLTYNFLICLIFYHRCDVHRPAHRHSPPIANNSRAQEERPPPRIPHRTSTAIHNHTQFISRVYTCRPDDEISASATPKQ